MDENEDTTDYSGYGNLTNADLTDLFSDQYDWSGYGNLTKEDLAELYKGQVDPFGGKPVTSSTFKSLMDYAKTLLGGKGTTQDYMQLLPLLGGLFGANQGSGPTVLNPGYQGGIPQVTATRTMLTQPPAGRRPGSGGINYGGDVTYTRTGQNLSAENAGISTPVSQPLGGTPTHTQPAAYDLASLQALIQQLQQFQNQNRPATPGAPGPTPGAPASAPSAASAGSGFVTGGGGGNFGGFSTQAEYDAAVAAKKAEDARRRAELEAYTPSAPFLAQYFADPSLIPRMHGESIEDAVLRLKAQDKDYTERVARKAAMRAGMPDVPVAAPAPAAPIEPDTLFSGVQTPFVPPTPGPSQVIADETGFTPPRDYASSTAQPINDLQGLFQQVYGRAGTDAEVQNLAGKSTDEARGILESSIANWRASQQSARPSGGFGGVQNLMEAAKGGLLPDGFVIPADVVSHLGNGSSEAGLELLAEELGAKPIKGDGDGMSDSIPTTIGGKQPARVANEEAFVPPDVVKKLGGGDTERGAKKLYAMMDRIRKARTGTTEQGKQINPEKFMPGGKVDKYAVGGTTTSPTAGITSSSLADWIGPYVADMLGKGQALTEMPYTAYTGPLTAGASPLQQLAFGTAANLQTPSQYGQAAGIAGGLATLAPNLRYTPQTTDFLGRPNVSGIDVAPSYGMSAPQPAATTSGFKGPAPIGEQPYSLFPRTPPGISVPAPAPAAPNPLYKGNGPRPEDMFTTQPVEGLPEMYSTQPVELQPTPFTQPGLPGAPMPSQPVGNIAQQYMNPYIESVVSPQLRELTRQADIARGADAARMAKAGAFGGSRQAIMEAEGRRNLMEKQSDVLGQGYATAYDKAMAQFNADQARRAAEAQFGATYGMEGVRTGLTGAQVLGQLGSQQQQSTIDNLRALAEVGATQRGIEAEGIAADKAQFEEARLNPYKMLQFQQSLLSGLPLASQSLVQPGQSNLQQFAGGFSTIAQALSYLYPNLFKNQAAPAKG